MKRIAGIASLVTKNAKVIDIGTDHAYLPIYLYNENITHDITASDISESVLIQSKKNIKEAGLENKIKILKSDGFKNVSDAYDEAIITGMGTKTIIDILSNTFNVPDSLIIGSQHNLVELRIFMQDFGYKILKEIVIEENGKYYDVIKYHKGKEKLTEDEIILGKSNNKQYLNYLKDKYQKIYEKSHDNKYLMYINIIEKRLNLN